MSYTVNENCIGCGVCAGICPDVFEMGEDGYSHVIAEPEDDETRELAEQAKESCPVAAIEGD
ncbi:MAG: ferredoxin [Clostridia bacterium]|nr:ferredoxin [Clostridia bacterium]